MSTRAFRTLDCAQKVRVRYYLPRDIDRAFLEALPCAKIEIEEFSKLVVGAKDLFRAASGQQWNASGVLGERQMVITFGKFGGSGESAEASILAIDAALEALGCGPVLSNKCADQART